jgi:hypothetical protein
MITEMIKEIITWLNNFPPKGGISQTMSPRRIISGLKFDYNMHCKIELGTYMQTHKEPVPSNSIKERMTGPIVIRSLNIVQGGYHFLSHNTGKLLKQRESTPLPMTSDVIARVEQIAALQGVDESLTFQD